MATQIQLRRGTTAQHAGFTGVVGEITVDTDKTTVVVHDGVTAGGIPLAVGADTGVLIHSSPAKTPLIDVDEIGIWDSVTGLLGKITWANIKATLKTYFDTLYGALATANLWTAQQRPKYLTTATASGGGSFAFDPATHGQIALITLTTAGVVTFSAPTNIVEGTPYTMLLKAGDTGARTFAWNAAFKFGGATSALSTATAVSGAIDSINWIGGAANTLIYNGHKGDIR